MIGALVAYMVQNLFVFDTPGTWLMFFFLLGLILVHEKDFLGRLEFGGDGPHKRFAATFLVLIGVLWGITHNLPILQSAEAQYWGFQLVAKGKISEGIKSFNSAIKLSTPYTDDFSRDFAASIVTAHFYNPGLVPQEEVRVAVNYMEEVVRHHREDAMAHSMLADIYTQASDIDPETYLPRAIESAKRALELSPQRQEAYFAWAKAEFLRGDAEMALKLLRETIVLAPEVPDAHFYYGIILSQTGDFQGAYQSLKQSIAFGREWRNYYEPREVANIFANAGRFPEAVDLYLATLKMNPSDDETRLKLGVAYFFMGERDLARKTLKDVLERVDLRTKPSYPRFRPILEELDILPI